ncbi:MAG: N-acetyltransferase [Tissierellia bacterium]|nr:N-acetyltransferase [Tissierellia bacterium]
MKIIIRQENQKDYRITESVVEQAFKRLDYDPSEHILVSKLRKSHVFIPELSLIAEVDGRIVGHTMLTKLIIKNGEKEYESLALAPVSVLPSYQNKGVGTALVNEVLKIAKNIGFKSAIVLGHPNYYPRFGFKPASIWGIKPPFDVSDDVFMALELECGSLEGVTGIVEYPKEFFE